MQQNYSRKEVLGINLKWNRIRHLRIKLTIAFSSVFILMLVALTLINAFFMDNVIIKYNEYAMRKELNTIIEEHSPFTKDKLSVIRKGSPHLIFTTPVDGATPLIENSLMDPSVINLLKSTPNLIQQLRDHGGEPLFLVAPQSSDMGRDMYLLYEQDTQLVIIHSKGAMAFEAIKVNAIFMFFASILIFVIGTILIWMISTQFGRKVKHLTDKTFKMSLCDFSDPIHVNNTDEIGQLAEHINHMSNVLESIIEDLKTSNTTLNIELEKERNMEQMRRQFVSDVSHELKNPLSMIQGYADGLYFDIPDTPEDQKYYQKVIVDETERLGHLLKDLLDLSSYESGTFSLKYEDIQLNQLVDSTIDKYSLQLSEKNLKLEFIEGELPTIEADGSRLEQIIVNLVLNAIKYSDPSGKIVIKTENNIKSVVLTVGNTGPLISPKQRELIWNSFHRIDSTKSGNGLGLAIVKSLVVLHKGQCTVEVKDKMNWFKIHLPVERIFD